MDLKQLRSRWPAIRQAVSGGTDWISPLGSESARVLQLLRRATFGGRTRFAAMNLAENAVSRDREID